MTQPLQNYVPNMVHEFYANYTTILNNITPSGKEKDIKMQPGLDTIWVWNIEVDISVRAILRALFVEVFIPPEDTSEYYFQMNDLKRVKMLSVGDKIMHYRWIMGHNAKAV